MRMLACLAAILILAIAPVATAQQRAAPLIEELPAQQGVRMVMIRFPTPIVGNDADQICRTLNYAGGAKFSDEPYDGVSWVICATRA